MDRERFTNWNLDWQSLAAPVVLIVTGLLLVAGASLGVLSLARIEDLWPVAAILIGLSELAGPAPSRPHLLRTEKPEDTATNGRR
ncbi:MAG: hypothetical protein JOY54_00630 [Acidobacteriaceae bacterium]|nr:hypothetical protein [Acidobacteriaceae bacterium]